MYVVPFFQLNDTSYDTFIVLTPRDPHCMIYNHLCFVQKKNLITVQTIVVNQLKAIKNNKSLHIRQLAYEHC